MIWLGIVGLAVVALAPLALSLRTAAVPRGRREAALALHRAQLAELDHDLMDQRIALAEHAVAVLEVQRRLLAAAGTADPEPAQASRSTIWAALALVPLAAILLYLTGGSPWLPAAPLSQRMAAAEQRVREEVALIDRLRDMLKTLDPSTERARDGYVLLGNAEARLGDMPGAAAAWVTALQARFDPTLAVEAAEAATEASGHVTMQAEELFRRALAEAPADAPWRSMARKRLGEVSRTAPAATGR